MATKIALERPVWAWAETAAERAVCRLCRRRRQPHRRAVHDAEVGTKPGDAVQRRNGDAENAARASGCRASTALMSPPPMVTGGRMAKRGNEAACIARTLTDLTPNDQGN